MQKSKFLIFLQVLFIFIIIILISLGLYEFFKKMFYYLSQLKPEISATLLAAFLTILIPITLHFITKYYERKNEIIKEMRNKRTPTYDEFMNFVFKLINAGKTNDNLLTSADIIIFLNDFIQRIILLWPDHLVKEFIIFRKKLMENDKLPNDSGKNLFALENLIYKIRKDLGYKNINLKKGDILSLFINDIKNYLK